MLDSKPVSTPMVTKSIEKQQEIKIENEPLGENIPYRGAIGCLLYLAKRTRPDIAYAVNMLSRNQTNPTVGNWMKVKRVFRYLKGTLESRVVFEGIVKENEKIISCFCRCQFR